MKKQIALVGAAMGAGAQLALTSQGPSALKEWNLKAQLMHLGVDCVSFEILEPNVQKPPLEQISEFSHQLKQKVASLKEQGYFPVVIGGDHSIAIGTWAGVASLHQKDQSLGLIWVDAHMDAHTFETTPSKAIHGMPVATLLGYGDEKLVKVNPFPPTLRPSHLKMIGMRSFEGGEAALLKKLQVDIAFQTDVDQKSFAYYWDSFLQSVSSQVHEFGVSIDLDAFDPTVAPGVGSPEGNGLLREPVISVLPHLQNYANFSCLEIAEYNPNRDHQFQTATLIRDILVAIFS